MEVVSLAEILAGDKSSASTSDADAETTSYEGTVRKDPNPDYLQLYPVAGDATKYFRIPVSAVKGDPIRVDSGPETKAPPVHRLTLANGATIEAVSVSSITVGVNGALGLLPSLGQSLFDPSMLGAYAASLGLVRDPGSGLYYDPRNPWFPLRVMIDPFTGLPVAVAPHIIF